MSSQSLSSKLVSLVVASTILPLICVVTYSYIGNKRMAETSHVAILDITSTGLDKMAESLYSEADLAKSMLGVDIAKISSLAASVAE